MTARWKEVINIIFSGDCIEPLILRVPEWWPWSTLHCSGFDSANIQVNYHTHTENNRIWWEEKVQEWNQAIKEWTFCWTGTVMSWERSKPKRLKIQLISLHQKGSGNTQGCRALAIPAKPNTDLQARKTPFRPLTSLVFFSQSSASLLYLRGRKIHLAFANGCDSMQRRVSTDASLSEPWELLVP